MGAYRYTSVRFTLFPTVLNLTYPFILTISRQNNVVELYSLFRFLRIKPFSDWAIFNEQIAKPIANGRGGTRAMKRLHVSNVYLLDKFLSPALDIARSSSRTSCFAARRPTT